MNNAIEVLKRKLKLKRKRLLLLVDEIAEINRQIGIEEQRQNQNEILEAIATRSFPQPTKNTGE
ncbi:MAG TPA: hypothetical protein ENG51_09405 [Deltaproteobacteria bacterium]|nr:hypothetical protein [Deltaproteobacteria bacterium]